MTQHEPTPGDQSVPEHEPVPEGRHEHGHEELDLGLREDRAPGRRRNRRKRRGPWGCLVILLIVIALVGGVAYAGVKGLDWVRGQFASEAEDYPGPGQGEVVVEVSQGDGTAAIGRSLKAADVVKSVTAFTEAAAQRSDEVAKIQPGFYSMKKQMKASDAVAVLVDPANADANAVVIPEGFRTDQVVARLAKTTGVKKAELEKALKDADGLGLPDYAEGEAEGYLFPAKYSFAPDDTALDMLAAMVKRYKAVAEEVPVSGASEAGLDEHDFITMASIIEKEVNRPEDMPAVAEVIFNRLDGSCVEQGIPKGLLQMDSTVHFLEGGGAGSVYTSAEARESDSPYNTYKQAGLPPGPIASPGQAAMEAILEPTDKGYCFFVAVDLDTGETRFARTGAEHTANTQLLQEWCRENSGRCG